ncbi:putative carbohydrate-binding protein [uncultured Mediterranean phage uvMED]|nr:putative carbohydrate-binding protein [uncultured Mediterranean phage uvMED]
MSLLDDVSIVVTPNGYKAGTLHGVIPSDGSADMDVTRATAGTRVDENGLINYAEILGSEITDITSGTPVDASNWANVTSNSVDFTGLGASGVSYYGNVATGLISGETYIISLTISNFSGSSDLGISGQGGVPTSFRFSSDGSNTETFTSDGNNIRIFGRAGTNTATFSNFSIKKADLNNVPRIDYSDGGCPHILAEPQRTNLVPYSEDFSEWNLQGSGTGSVPIITSNNTISPDGTQNADKIVFNKGAGVSTSDLSLISSDSFTTQSNTASFYIKADSPQKIVFRSSTNWRLVDVTTEWKRISKTDTGNSVQIGLRDGYGISGIPDTATIYLWGAQAESGSYPTSYIPTLGSTVTRNQDVFSRDGIGSLINDTEGVLFTDIEFLTFAGADYLGLNDGTNTQRVLIERSGTSLRGNINSIQLTSTLSSLNNKLAIKWKLNDFQMYLNGVKVSEITSGSVPSGLDRLQFEIGGGLGLYFNGKVKQLQVYKTALTDAQLISLTS